MAVARRMGRGAALGVVVATLALGGCGRRGGLEPAVDPNNPFALGTPKPVTNARTGLPEKKKNPPIKPPNAPFLLDPLL